MNVKLNFSYAVVRKLEMHKLKNYKLNMKNIYVILILPQNPNSNPKP